jgi:hypothetical protein
VININEVKEFVNFVMNKNLNGAYTPKGFNQAIKVANLELFDELRGGKYSTYQPGRPVPIIGMEQNSTISEELDVFANNASITLTSGVGDLPSDHIQTLSLTSTNGYAIEWVRREDFDKIVKDPIDTPLEEEAIYKHHGAKKIKTSPSSIGPLAVSYLRAPATPVWGYTVSGSVATYNGVTSTNFEWNSTAFVALCAKILSYLGVNLSNEQIVGFSENMKGSK